jgi:hypothetical protein
MYVYIYIYNVYINLNRSTRIFIYVFSYNVIEIFLLRYEEIDQINYIYMIHLFIYVYRKLL